MKILDLPSFGFATVFNIYVANWANPKFSNGYNSVIFKVKIYEKTGDIENCNGRSKMQKYLKNKFGKIFLKIFEIRQFLIIEKRYF